MNPYVKGLKTVIFDVETMGLFPAKDMIISASFLEPETEALFQYFAESPADEVNLVQKILQKLSEYDAVITYNGDHFDLPYITARCRKYGLPSKLPMFWSIDMYRWLRKYWPAAKNMQSLRQKAVEAALGLTEDRTDQIDGGECIPLYNEFLFSGKTENKDLILLHNADDVRQLCRIYKASDFLPYHKIAFEKGFGSRCFLVKSIELNGNNLKVNALSKPGDIPAAIYEDTFNLNYDTLSGETELTVQLQKNGNMLFADLKSLNIDGFETYAGYFSDYLILFEEKPLYREINALIQKMLVKYMGFSV